jgi:hypothetical protein
MAFSKSLEQGRCPGTHFGALPGREATSVPCQSPSVKPTAKIYGWSGLNWPLGPLGGTLGMR